MEDFMAAVIGMAILLIVLVSSYQIGKHDMRGEIKTYGCEQAMKAYEAK